MGQDSAELLEQYRRGDGTAADALFRRYADRLLALARSRISPRLARRIDAEDVVQSAYRSFFLRARSGRFVAEQEGDLWRLLATITLHKLARQAKHHQAAKRSIGRETTGPEDPFPAGKLADRQPSVADVIVAADELSWLLAQLVPIEREAVQLRLTDLTHAEIAARLGRSERSVRRWLAEARELLASRWAREQTEDNAATDSATPPNAVQATDPAAPLAHADYRLEALIGSGGVAKVYVATHRPSGQRVAVKVLRKRLRSRPHLVERFVQEARLVASIRHPNIVPVHGLGRFPDGGYFLVLDFIDGGDLSQLCRQGRLPADQASEIVAAVADAMQYAHERGVIHRDLKPGNVLIDHAGQVHVTDFGFAWTAAEANQADSIVGTAGFMAPEQFDRRHGAIGPATDVYGLGALLLALVGGQAPRRGGTVSEIVAQVSLSGQPAAAIPTPLFVPPALRAMIDRCLAADPADRFPSAAAVAAALRQHPVST